jgi:hypothetical protein
MAASKKSPKSTAPKFGYSKSDNRTWTPTKYDRYPYTALEPDGPLKPVWGKTIFDILPFASI